MTRHIDDSALRRTWLGLAVAISMPAFAACSEPGKIVLPPEQEPLSAHDLRGTWKLVSVLERESGVERRWPIDRFTPELRFEPTSNTEGDFVYWRTDGLDVRGRFDIAWEDAPGNDFIVMEPGIDHLERSAWVTLFRDTLRMNGVMDGDDVTHYVRVSDSPAEPPAMAALRAHAALWAERGPRDYEMVVHRPVCFCLPEWMVPIRLTVRDGEIRVVTHAETGEMIADPPYHAMTIEELFAVIEKAINMNADVLEVRYDETLGYPVSIHSNVRVQMPDGDSLIEVLELI